MPEEKLPRRSCPNPRPSARGETLTALADAILATDEPEEIADVPEDDELGAHPRRARQEGKAGGHAEIREERLSNLIEKGKKAGKLTLKEIADVIDGLNLAGADGPVLRYARRAEHRDRRRGSAAHRR